MLSIRNNALRQFLSCFSKRPCKNEPQCFSAGTRSSTYTLLIVSSSLTNFLWPQLSQIYHLCRGLGLRCDFWRVQNPRQKPKMQATVLIWGSEGGHSSPIKALQHLDLDSRNFTITVKVSLGIARTWSMCDGLLNIDSLERKGACMYFPSLWDDDWREGIAFLLQWLTPETSGNIQSAAEWRNFWVLCPGSTQHLQRSEKLVLSARLCILCKFLELKSWEEKETLILKWESWLAFWVFFLEFPVSLKSTAQPWLPHALTTEIPIALQLKESISQLCVSSAIRLGLGCSWAAGAEVLSYTRSMWYFGIISTEGNLVILIKVFCVFSSTSRNSPHR